MRQTGILILALSLATVEAVGGEPDMAMADELNRPNVLIVLADDLGFSDVGCFGGEIQTPNLDALAAGGLRFTQFYNTSRCWPTRAALLTGYYPQAIRRDAVEGVPGGASGIRPVWATLVSEMLRAGGYHSYHAGKWHIDGTPLANGFEHSYWLEDADQNFGPKVHYSDDQKLPPVAIGSGYYSTTAIANEAIEQLKQHQVEHGSSPFFQYVAFLSPHFPLHAPAEDVARYRDRYRDGWNVARQARWERIRALGLFPESTRLSPVEREVGPPYDNPESMAALGSAEVNRPVPWEELTEEQKTFQADKMAVHAAMVDRIDQEVGRIVEQVRAMGAIENTLILFLSDNGASAEILVRGGGHDPRAEPGSAESFLCLGPGWSTVANTPFRRHKAWVHEGGIATPLIVHWPAGIPARGELRHDPGHVVDVAPTVLELAGVVRPDMWKGSRVPAWPGRSLVPAFTQDGSLSRQTIWFAHRGTRAIRMGDWKLVADQGGPWELYDLNRDRTETDDRAALEPERAQAMAAEWERWKEAFRQQATDSENAVGASGEGVQP